MKKLLFTLFILIMILQAGFSQTKAEMAVASAVETLRKAMVDGDKMTLKKITSDALSYGHSSGKVEDQATFINSLVTGKSDFVSIDLTNQTVKVVGKTAIVRHRLSAKTNDNGKPGEVHLDILTIWQKQKGHWILLARQAVKVQ